MNSTSIKRTPDETGDGIKVFDDANGLAIQAVGLTDELGNQTGINSNPLDVSIENIPHVVVDNFPTSETVTVSNPVTSVAVSNFPSTQTISGTVAVSNPVSSVSVSNIPHVVVDTLPSVTGTVAISGTPGVSVTNVPHVVVDTLPAVSVSNFPGTQAVSGAVSVSNVPHVVVDTIPAVSISNFPATQTLSGTSSVSVDNIPHTIIDSIPGVSISNVPHVTVDTMPAVSVSNIPHVVVDSIPATATAAAVSLQTAGGTPLGTTVVDAETILDANLINMSELVQILWAIRNAFGMPDQLGRIRVNIETGTGITISTLPTLAAVTTVATVTNITNLPTLANVTTVGTVSNQSQAGGIAMQNAIIGQMNMNFATLRGNIICS